MSAMWGARTRRTSVSAMIAPRERWSPAALSRSASSSRALWTATPSLTGSSAPSQVIVSGAGRSVVCRSPPRDGAARPRDPGSNRQARSSTAPTSSRSPIASNLAASPAMASSTSIRCSSDRQAVSLASRVTFHSLIRPGPERLVGAGQLGAQHLREPDVALPAVRGLPARERDLLGDPATLPLRGTPRRAAAARWERSKRRSPRPAPPPPRTSAPPARGAGRCSSASSSAPPAPASRRVQDPTSPADGSATSVAATACVEPEIPHDLTR